MVAPPSLNENWATSTELPTIKLLFSCVEAYAILFGSVNDEWMIISDTFELALPVVNWFPVPGEVK